MVRHKRARWRLSPGQLVIPAMFVIPSLVLFVYLIYETAKLSREKIRHQFAIDAAAFVEMTNYSDLLNRSAYVNGPFPMRVFSESYPWGSVPIEAKNSTAPTDLIKMMYDNGAFPVGPTQGSDPSFGISDGMPTWPIKYGNGSLCTTCSVLNGNSPGDTGTQHIFRQKQVMEYWIWYDVHSVPLWQFWTTVYSLLGSVESAQVQVFQRLNKAHSFLKKSWLLNTGESSSNVNTGSFDSHDLRLDCIYTRQSGTYGTYQKSTWWDPYGHKGFGDDPDVKDGGGKPFTHPPEGGTYCSGGLFRVAVVTSGLDQIKIKGPSSGIELMQPWSAPGNYFNVDVNRPRPMVHARVGIVGCCVWAENGSPQPTPKFQVRELP
jgi:hypothetical protein